MTADTREAYTVWVCVDCYLTHHGVREDNTPPDREPLALIPAAADVFSGMAWDEHDCVNAVDIDPWRGPVECECERQTFSRSVCGGCGSTLAGEREALTVSEVSA